MSKEYQPLTMYMRKSRAQELIKPQRMSLQGKHSLPKQSKSFAALSKHNAKQTAQRKSSHRRILSWIPQKNLQVQKGHNQTYQTQTIEKLIQILSPWEGIKTFEEVLRQKKQPFTAKRKTRQQQKNYSIEDHLKLVRQSINQSIKVCQNTKSEQGSKLLALIEIFKKTISDLTTIFIEEQVCIIERYQSSIHQIGKQYDQIYQKLNIQTIQLDKQKQVIKRLKGQLCAKRQMGCFVSSIFAQMELKGINIEQWIVNSQYFERHVLIGGYKFDKDQECLGKYRNQKVYSLNYSKNGDSIQKNQF